jgi:uncharacterized protein YeeX (DUF496 family)
MSKELLQQVRQLKCENKNLQENYDRVSLLNIQLESDIDVFESNISVPNKPYAWSFKYVSQDVAHSTIRKILPDSDDDEACFDIVPLYTMPVRVPMTDTLIAGIILDLHKDSETTIENFMFKFARKIEEAHEIRRSQ